jgi:uncharacterized RDD family membrane protein YckC
VEGGPESNVTRTDALLIRTPEGIEFALPLAGPFTRMIAAIVDLIVVMVSGILLERALAPLNLFGQDAAQAVIAVAYFAFSMLYGAACEWFWHGQTVGKRLLGLRVVEASGLRLNPSQIVVRNVMRLFDMLPAFYLAGGIACVWNHKRQRLGDLVAGTAVIRVPKLSEPDLSQLEAGRQNSLARERHLAARLRQKVSPQMAGVALEALLRREALDPDSRLALFRDLSSHFKLLVTYPAEIVEQLSDEQYVRDVVEILYTRTAGTTNSRSTAAPV